MSDPKYRQRGYQDDSRERDRQASTAQAPRGKSPGSRRSDHEGPKTPNLMASHEVFRCSRCGNRLSLQVEADGHCSRCGIDLHSCIQCVSFDTSARFECTQPIPARIAPKDARNACTVFTPRATVERQTGTQGPTSTRQAFDDLFK